MKEKNYFGSIVIATAMLGATVFSSCSHDDYYYSEDKVEQSVNEKYAVAFEKAFGQVGPNVDWGFNSKKANKRAFTRAGEVAFPSTINFPDYCDASCFLNDVPNGVQKLPVDGGGAGTPWFIDGETQSVSTWLTGGTLYVKGYVDLSSSNFDINPDWQIYLVKGSTLKISAASAETLLGVYYVGEDATLETLGSLKLNSGAKVYTHEKGTVKVKDIEVNTNSILYNKGTLKATGTLSAESNPAQGDLSYIVNGGSIECADVVVNAGAMLNYFEWKVSGTTHINSNNSGWINNGHWTTVNYAYIGGSVNVINNCLLEVSHDFEMNISSVTGAFKINSDGGVLTENFYGGRDSSTGAISGPFRIMMAQNAVFVVEKTAQFESGRGDEEGFGIFGPSSTSTGEYAVFQAKDIVRDPTLASQRSHGAVTYGGKLYVSAETHFAQGYDSDGSGAVAPKPFIYVKDGFTLENIYASGFSTGKPNINIPKTGCSPGFIGGDPLYRVIAEDLSASEAGDFDFNDVVFDIVKAEGGKTTLKLICAGGVLPLKVMGVEVHGLFGETEPTNGKYKMYNTGAGPTVEAVTFDIDGTYTTPEQIKNIKIEVLKEDIWMELKATTGEAACKILVDDTFKPVPERKNIADENKKFTDYVQGKFVDDFWWK